MPGPFAPLRVPRYRNLWLASVASNVGSFFQTVAAAWLMQDLTGGSATWVGLMIASSMLPLLLFGLPAGVVADAFDRAKVLVVTQATMAAAAATMAVLSVLGVISPLSLFLLGLAMGVGMAFNMPAWQALVPDLVPQDLVPSAVALNSVAFNVARAAGPALGGVVVAAAGPEAAFGINALSFTGVLAVMWGLVGKAHRPEGAVSLRSGMAVAVRYARFTPTFRRILVLASLLALTSATVQATLPVLTTELGGTATTYGLLLGAMGAGAVAGTVARPRLVRVLGTRFLPSAVGAFGVAGIALGASPSPAAAAVAMIVAGACWVWALTTLNATSQLLAPGWIRGRAMSLYTLAFSGVYPLGSILAGALADRIGAGGADMVLSGAALALGLAIPAFRIPAIDEVASPVFTDDRIPSPHLDAEGGPVMVENTWVVDPSDLDELVGLLNGIRLVRLRTGGYRWRLYRDPGSPGTLVEIFECPSWEEHLAQHSRIDDDAAELIRRARSLDRRGEPTTRHLLGFDTTVPGEWQRLLHTKRHAEDGSIPEVPQDTSLRGSSS